MKRHPLIHTLLNLEGNSKACVYTEPLYGIPYNLFAPYATIYMYALGVNDRQIGLIASIGMFFQILFSFLGGAITDKLGRRYTTLIFDLVCWSMPALIWALSKNFYYFVAAAIFNSVSRVTMNSWNCLLVEDCDKNEIVNIYAWIYIAALGSAFVAPLSGLLVDRYELIPTVRALYAVFFIVMTTKIMLTFKYSTETKQGMIRLEDTKNMSINNLLSGYGEIIKKMLGNPETMLTLGLMLVMSIFSMVNNTFWSLAVTERIHIAQKYLGIFPFIRSIVMLGIFFTVIPKINALKFKKPMFIGFGILLISQSILIITPEKDYIILVVSIILEALSISIINPLLDSMQVVMVDVKERARVIAVLYVIVIALTSPFGWIAGVLSAIDRRLPFVMNIMLLIAGIILTYLASAASKRKLVINPS